MKYSVTIKEILSRTIQIEADDEYAAADKATSMYKNGEIVLSSDDYIGEPEISVEEDLTEREHAVYAFLRELPATLKDKILEYFWSTLEDIPTYADDSYKEYLGEWWLFFKRGAEVEEDVWRFFDNEYSKGVAYLLNDLDYRSEEDFCREILTELGAKQKKSNDGVCPRCGGKMMEGSVVRNALSQYYDVYICPDCGTDEAPRYAKNWYFIKKLDAWVGE